MPAIASRYLMCGFLNRAVPLHIVTDPAYFQDNKSKIVYAASFLRGLTRDWWTPNINPYTGGVKFDIYVEFLTALSNDFNNPDSEATAARKIRRLR